MTIQRNNANTATSRLEAQERQDVRKGEAVNLEETQKNRQQEPSEAAKILATWSVCLIVASVCFVCLALRIHAPRGDFNTIIDFMMVSSRRAQSTSHPD